LGSHSPCASCQISLRARNSFRIAKTLGLIQPNFGKALGFELSLGISARRDEVSPGSPQPCHVGTTVFKHQLVAVCDVRHERGPRFHVQLPPELRWYHDAPVRPDVHLNMCH